MELQPDSRRATVLLGCVLAVCVVAGCASDLPTRYVAPRLEGRVLDAQTHRPIQGVAIRRNESGEDGAFREVPKGGQAIQQAPVVRSKRDGTFVLESQRDLALLIHSGWYSVDLAFQRTGYAVMTTNYTLLNATLTPGGEPLVKTGDILLDPLTR